MMNDGTRIAMYDRICVVVSGVVACEAACNADQPPIAATPNGTARANPVSLTDIWIMLTQADDRSPPATKYADTTAPPITQPSHLGIAATTPRISEMAMSCPARI